MPIRPWARLPLSACYRCESDQHLIPEEPAVGTGKRITALFALILCSLSLAAADDPQALYQATSIVTGRDNAAERARGTREAFETVVARLCGDRGVVQQLGPLTPTTLETLVASRRYTDRKAGIQIADEQGTRDRSFLLEVSFRAQALQRLLTAAGQTPWLGPRPTIGVQLQITDNQGSYHLTETSRRGWGQREVFRTLTRRTAIPLALPRDPADRPAVDGTLSGVMTVTPDGTWASRWSLTLESTNQGWVQPPATFDRAIGEAVWRMAGLLARQATGTE
jgi:hypothetical protein